MNNEAEKYYLSVVDVVGIEGMFRVIESIPSKNAGPAKQWLAKLGSERIDKSTRAMDMTSFNVTIKKIDESFRSDNIAVTKNY